MMNKELFLKQAKELLNEKVEDGSLVFKISHGLDEETKFFDGEYSEDLEKNIAKVIECLRLKGECAYAFEKLYALILKDRIDTKGYKRRSHKRKPSQIYRCNIPSFRADKEDT